MGTKFVENVRASKCVSFVFVSIFGQSVWQWKAEFHGLTLISSAFCVDNEQGFHSFIITTIFLIRAASILLIQCNGIYHIGFSIYTCVMFY